MNIPTQTNGACKPWSVVCSVQACAYRLQSNLTKKGTKPPDAEWKHKSGFENAVRKRLYKFSLSVLNIKRTVVNTCCCTQILLWPTLPMDYVIGKVGRNEHVENVNTLSMCFNANLTINYLTIAGMENKFKSKHNIIHMNPKWSLFECVHLGFRWYWITATFCFHIADKKSTKYRICKYK